MTEGIVATLPELIALQRLVKTARYRTVSQSVRAGGYHSKARGRGMDFIDARNYQAGDEIRHMEWRVTARTGRPHIKLYEEERERPVVILVDFNPSMYFGTRVAFKSCIAAKLASLIAWSANAQGDRVGGLICSATAHREFPPKAREAGVLPLLAELALQTKEIPTKTTTPSQGLSEALLRLRRVAKPGSLLVLISDFYTMDEACEQQLSRLQAHNALLAYHLCDPLELSAPLPGLYPVTNGSRIAYINTLQSNAREAYQQACSKRIDTLQNTLKRLHTQYIQVTAQHDLAFLVHQTFPRRSHG